MMSLQAFLNDFPIVPPTENLSLAKDLFISFRELAKTSSDQFLPTPILEENFPTGHEKGRCLAIDIGGTNLRVGVIELLGDSDTETAEAFAQSIEDGSTQEEVLSTKKTQIRKSFEMSWEIDEEIKNAAPQRLFSWVGGCMAEVIGNDEGFPDRKPDDLLPVGITFSFPMIQQSLTEAKIMSMSKGFTLATDMDLGDLILEGYEKHRVIADLNNSHVENGDHKRRELPKLKISAIVNDAVATFITINYDMKSLTGKKVPMSFICATGGNATVAMPLKGFGSFKLPKKVASRASFSENTEFIVNTEWEMAGSAGPLKPYMTKWDFLQDRDLPIPGQQPYDYMTAGRYLGELARLMAVDYFTNILQIDEAELPLKLRQRHGLTTAFIGSLSQIPTPHGRGHEDDPLVLACRKELPHSPGSHWVWGSERADAVAAIALRVRQRAAMLMGSAIVAMLFCIGELDSRRLFPSTPLSSRPPVINGSHEVGRESILVGYTGGCIMHYPEYLSDVEKWVDDLTTQLSDPEHPAQKEVVKFVPVIDGGILGAGILACKTAANHSI